MRVRMGTEAPFWPRRRPTGKSCKTCGWAAVHGVGRSCMLVSLHVL